MCGTLYVYLLSIVSEVLRYTWEPGVRGGAWGRVDNGVEGRQMRFICRCVFYGLIQLLRFETNRLLSRVTTLGFFTKQ
jgi:hypothetical protein